MCCDVTITSVIVVLGKCVSDVLINLHLSVRQALLEFDAEVLEACASLLDVVDRDGDVAETLSGLLVAVGVALEVGIIFGSVLQ